ncbi:MAG: phage holin family protein [Burkholderiales bacterium]
MDRPPGEAGPLDSARALGSSFLALLGTRVELAALEFKEEAARRKRLAVLALVAAVFLGVALVLLAFLVVVFFWDTHRLAAIAGVTLAYAAVGAGAFLRLRAVLKDSPPPFSATLEEFRRDLDMVRGSDE